MSKMNLCGAAVLAAVLSTSALAGPIAFDFSGVVQRRTVTDHGTFTEDLSGQGQSFTARVVIDTDLMTLSQFSTSPGGSSQWQSTDFLPAPSELSLDVNGAPFAIPLYELNTYAVTVQDGLQPAGCAACGVSDSVNLLWRSQQNQPVVGQQLASTFSFTAYEVGSNGVSPSYIDLGTPFDLDSLLTIPLPNLTLQFGTTIFECEALNQCFANYTDTTWFTTTSVTRTDLSRVAVPEPGSLALLFSGVLAIGFLRRRRTV